MKGLRKKDHVTRLDTKQALEHAWLKEEGKGEQEKTDQQRLFGD